MLELVMQRQVYLHNKGIGRWLFAVAPPDQHSPPPREVTFCMLQCATLYMYIEFTDRANISVIYLTFNSVRSVRNRFLITVKVRIQTKAIVR